MKLIQGQGKRVEGPLVRPAIPHLEQVRNHHPALGFEEPRQTLVGLGTHREAVEYHDRRPFSGVDWNVERHHAIVQVRGIRGQGPEGER